MDTDAKKKRLRAKKQRLAYAQKRARGLGINVTEYNKDKEIRRKERRVEQKKKSKRMSKRLQSMVASGKVARTLESSTVFVEIAYRDVRECVKKKRPHCVNKEEMHRYENILMNELEAGCMKKLHTAKLLGKYSQDWEAIGSVTVYNFSVTESKKAFPLVKRFFKQRAYLKKFKIYSYGYYTDHTQELLARETIVNA